MSSKGYTLVEVLVAIGLGALIIVLATAAASKYLFSARISELERNAGHVLSALDAYYEEMCSNGTSPQPTISALIGRGYIQSARFTRNPFGDDLQVRMLWGTPTRIQVSARLTSRHRIAGSVGADRVVGQSMFWERLPRLLTSETTQEIMEHKHFHEPGACR